MDYDELYTKAENLGKEHGRAAGSWFFGNNAHPESYVKVLKGIEDGDPEIMDLLPNSPLSGEMSDGMTPTGLMRTLGLLAESSHVDSELESELCLIYEDGFRQGAEDEIVRVCKFQLT